MYNASYSAKGDEHMESIFLRTFGDTPYLKVLDFFLNYPDFDYSKTYVASQTGVSRITIENIWAKLVKEQILVKNRRMGRAELYKLNTANPLVGKLLKIDYELSTAYAGTPSRKIALEKTRN